jgi:hypothetical protein
MPEIRNWKWRVCPTSAAASRTYGSLPASRAHNRNKICVPSMQLRVPATTGRTRLPGLPFPRGPLGTVKGVNFSLFSESPSRWSCACSMRRANEQAHSHPRAHQRRVAYLRAGHRAGPAVWLSRARTLRSGKRAAVQSQQVAARSVRQRRSGVLRVGRRAVRLSAGRSREATCPSMIATARPSRRLARSSITRFDWSGERRPRIAAHETIVYEAHVRGMTQLHPDVPPKHARHLCRHGLRTHHQAPARLGRDRHRIDAGALFSG